MISNIKFRKLLNDLKRRPEDAAEDVLDAITKDRFLVTPHPEVLEYINRKGADRDRWISGMQRLQERYEDWMPEKID